MQNNPISGYPENPEKKSKLELVSIMIERHNFLIDQVSKLEKVFEEKNNRLDLFKEEVKKDIDKQKKLLEENKELFEVLEKVKKDVVADFKQVAKRPLFEKLTKRVNELKYEEFMHREELMRKLE